MKVLRTVRLTIPEAKTIMEERVNEGNVKNGQRLVLTYLQKYSKVSRDAARRLVEALQKEFGFDEFTSIQIVNIMPETVEELRTLIPRDRYVSSEEAERILSLLREYSSG